MSAEKVAEKNNFVQSLLLEKASVGVLRSHWTLSFREHLMEGLFFFHYNTWKSYDFDMRRYAKFKTLNWGVNQFRGYG